MKIKEIPEISSSVKETLLNQFKKVVGQDMPDEEMANHKLAALQLVEKTGLLVNTFFNSMVQGLTGYYKVEADKKADVVRIAMKIR